MRDDRRHAPSRQGQGGKRDSGGGGAARGRATRAFAPPPVDAAELTTLLDPVVRAASMDLESVRVGAAGRRRLLRVVVDCDGGAGLDEIADVSRDIAARLDASDTMGNIAYTLEVSSPGIDRPLTEPRHWRRARGRLVAAPLTGTDGGQVTGRVVAASDTGVTLDVDGRYRELTYAQLGPGRVQVEFGKPGGGAGSEEPEAARSQAGDGGSAGGH
jgi:ribosome maturation factor RimP